MVLLSIIALITSWFNVVDSFATFTSSKHISLFSAGTTKWPQYGSNYRCNHKCSLITMMGQRGKRIKKEIKKEREMETPPRIQTP